MAGRKSSSWITSTAVVARTWPIIALNRDLISFISSAALRDAVTVYHLAAQSTVVGAVDDLDYSIESNVIGAFNVLRAAANAGVTTLVFA